MLSQRGSRCFPCSPLLRLSALVGILFVVFEGTWQEKERRGDGGALSLARQLLPSTRAVVCVEETFSAQQPVVAKEKTGKGKTKAKKIRKRKIPKRIWLWNTSVQDLKRWKFPKNDHRRSTWLSKGTADTLFKALKIAGEAFQVPQTSNASTQEGDVAAPQKITGNPSIWKLSSKAKVRYLTLDSAQDELIGKYSTHGFGFSLSGFLSILVASANVASPVYEATFCSAGKRIHTFSKIPAPLQNEEEPTRSKKKTKRNEEEPLLESVVGKEEFYGSVFFTAETPSFWSHELEMCILESIVEGSEATKKKPSSPPFEGLEAVSEMATSTGEKKPLRIKLKSLQDFWDLVDVMEFLANGRVTLLSCSAFYVEYVKQISLQLKSFQLEKVQSRSIGSVIIYEDGTAGFVADDVLGGDKERRKLQLLHRNATANNILKGFFTIHVRSLRAKKRKAGRLIFVPVLAGWEQLVEEKSVQDILPRELLQARETRPVVRNYPSEAPWLN